MRKLWLFVALVPALLGPGARATPAECASPCTIETLALGYVLPVTEIASGTEVLWQTSDSAHPTADFGSPSARCFQVSVGAGVDPVPVRFDVTGGGVEATQNGQTKPCTLVGQLPTGGWVVPFHCLLHPHMVGTLVVAPGV